MKKVAVLLIAVTVSGCEILKPQPPVIPQEEIDAYKQTLKQQCIDQGIKNRDSETRINALCECTIRHLDNTLREKDWRNLTGLERLKDRRSQVKILSNSYSSLKSECGKL